MAAKTRLQDEETRRETAAGPVLLAAVQDFATPLWPRWPWSTVTCTPCIPDLPIAHARFIDEHTIVADGTPALRLLLRSCCARTLQALLPNPSLAPPPQLRRTQAAAALSFTSQSGVSCSNLRLYAAGPSCAGATFAAPP